MVNILDKYFRSNKNPKQEQLLSDSIDQSALWVKEAIEKEAKDYISNVVSGSNSTVITMGNDKRLVFKSRFLDQELKPSIPTMPLGYYSPTNPYIASLPDKLQLENVLDTVSLTETADAFFADGIMRRIMSDFLDYVFPDYIKFAVVGNKVYDENKGKLRAKASPSISNGNGNGSAKNNNESKVSDAERAKRAEEFKELNEGDIAYYHIKVSKLLENINLYDRSIKLLATSMIFGRNGLMIAKDRTDKTFTKFGKPTGLILLNPLQIKKAIITDNETYKFGGFEYDWQVKDKTADIIGRDQLIPFFYDDFNIYKNTYYSGLTRLFSLVGISHGDQLINSYDIPEATQSVYTGNNWVYVGKESPILVTKFANSHQRGINYHDQPALHVEAAQASGKILEIVDTRLMNYKSACMILGIPLFLLFEDEANFATAAIAMQSFINGRVQRLGQLFADTLQEYFFMPLLADISNIELDTLKEDYVNYVKVIMPKITLETKTDRINNAIKLWNVYDMAGNNCFGNSFVQFFKYIGEDQLADMAEPLDKLQNKMLEDVSKGNFNEATINMPLGSKAGMKFLTDFKTGAGQGERSPTKGNDTSTQGEDKD